MKVYTRESVFSSRTLLFATFAQTERRRRRRRERNTPARFKGSRQAKRGENLVNNVPRSGDGDECTPFTSTTAAQCAFVLVLVFVWCVAILISVCDCESVPAVRISDARKVMIGIYLTFQTLHC